MYHSSDYDYFEKCTLPKNILVTQAKFVAVFFPITQVLLKVMCCWKAEFQRQHMCNP